MLCQIGYSYVGVFVFCAFGCPTLSTSGCVGISVGVANWNLLSLWGLGVSDCLHNFTFGGVCLVLSTAVGTLWWLVDASVLASAVEA